jgi:lipid A disaccharide synthetase
MLRIVVVIDWAPLLVLRSGWVDALAQEETAPDILLTIDFKGFNFRLLKAVHKSCRMLTQSQGQHPRVPTCVHYVAPSIWAYKRDPTKTLNFL